MSLGHWKSQGHGNSQGHEMSTGVPSSRYKKGGHTRLFPLPFRTILVVDQSSSPSSFLQRPWFLSLASSSISGSRVILSSVSLHFVPTLRPQRLEHHTTLLRPSFPVSIRLTTRRLSFSKTSTRPAHPRAPSLRKGMAAPSQTNVHDQSLVSSPVVRARLHSLK